VNTFKRNDLLETFTDYYKSCLLIKQIQVIWSDVSTPAPVDWIQTHGFPVDKLIFEVHDKNSLNNRFRAIVAVETEV
jgi:hypothetical protein